MSYYARAEAIFLKYLYFLKENNFVKDYKIERATARNIYMTQFKPQNNVVRFSFSKMYRVMLEYGLIHYKKKEADFIYFKEAVFNYCIRYYTKSDLTETNNAAADGAAPNSIKSKPKIKCNICNLNFANANLLEKHEQTGKHLQKKRSISETQNSRISPDVFVEITKGHGHTSETICLRQHETKNLFLTIVNKSAYDYLISDFAPKNRSSSIVLKKLQLTKSILPANTKTSLEFTAMFKDSTFCSYPVAYIIKNVTTGVQSDVVKEIMFQVHSELVDDLHPTRPYQQPPKQDTRITEHEIVPGVPLPSDNTTKYKPGTKLLQYPLPQHMVVLLDNDFNEFASITADERKHLLHIRNEFKYYKNVGTLNRKNFYSINQLRLQMEEYQMKIDIRSYDVDNQELRTIKNYPKNFFELYVPGLSEHRPSVLCGDSVFIQENRDSKIKYEGIVHKLNQNSVILGMGYRFADNVYLKKNKYAVSFNFNRLPVRVEHQANQLANKQNVIQFFAPDVTKKNPINYNKFAFYNHDIKNNIKQQEAIKHIVSATAHPSPYLIFGPPGTGKTVTVVEAILQVRKLKPDQRILVSAPSNSAADEITKRLIKHVSKVDLFRYVARNYSYDLIDVAVKPYTNCKNEFYYPDSKELLKYHIVVTTLVTAFRLVNGGIPPNHFSYVFIDESGQATETETLIPIVGILTNILTPGAINGQIVLAGDPQQLGPVIHSQRANDIGYGISMLERLMTHCKPYKKVKGSYNSNVLTKLVNSYRSHPAILEQPNKLFYDGELIPPKNQELANIAVGWDELPNKRFPVIFHSVLGKDEREENSPSFFNVQEVDIVVSYLEKLIGSRLHGMKIEQSHIGLITPYRKQVYKLQTVCRKKKWDKLSIGSVEQFQGQERLIIIVSTVRSDPKFTAKDAKFHLGFLRNPKRMNVAMTRAKALLIIVGNPNLLQLDEHWGSFIKYCKENGAIAGTPFEILDSSTTENSLPLTNGATNVVIDKENVNFSRAYLTITRYCYFTKLI